MKYPHDHEKDIVFFARTNFRNSMRKFGVRTVDRRRHMYVIGKSGVGKTTMLENMMLADIYYGHGMGLLDPHGDSAEKIMDSIPDHRIQDVVYFNPADTGHCIGFNILESVKEEQRHLIASGLMGVFKKIWPDVWSARMEHIMNNTILSLLENPGNTLMGINRVLIDRDFRRKIVGGVRDPVVKSFWVTEFEQWDVKYRTEAIAPIQNKVGQFLSTSIIRNILAQEKSTIDMRDIMDNNKIFIMNLSKGRIGEDASRLLGGLLVTKMQLAAMNRVDIPEEAREDFYLYIDEFQNFATESFANILSEARKYKLCLIMAHQYVEQLDETVRAGVFGNAGTIVSFRIGAADAPILAVEFAPKFEEEDLVNLPMANIYLRLLCNGISTDPFSATTLPPIAVPTQSAQKAIAASRAQYAVPKHVVEERILRWSETKPQADAMIESPIPKEEKQHVPPWMHEYNCTRCNKYMQLPVELDRSRPIYCEECIEIVRDERKSGKKGGAPKSKAEEKPAKPSSIGSGEIVPRVISDKEVSLSALGGTLRTPEPERKEVEVAKHGGASEGRGDLAQDGEQKKKRRRRKRKSEGQPSSGAPQTPAASITSSNAHPQPPSGDDDEGEEIQAVRPDDLFPW